MNHSIFCKEELKKKSIVTPYVMLLSHKKRMLIIRIPFHKNQAEVKTYYVCNL